MGKRKKQQDFKDPILLNKVKRVKIKQPEELEEEEAEKNRQQQLEEENYESDEMDLDQEDNEEEEKQTEYEKFLNNLQLRKNQEMCQKEKLKQLKNLVKIPITKDTQLTVDPYIEHFDKNQKDLLAENIVEEIIVEKKKKKTESEKIRERMLDIFNFKEKQKSGKNDLSNKEEREATEQDLYKVKIKNYELKAEGKKKAPQYQIQNYQQFIFDSNSLRHFSQGINGHNTSFLFPKLLPSLTGVYSNDNDDEDKDVRDFEQTSKKQVDEIPYSIIKNYADLSFIDPNEENIASFRKQYITHIINHVVKGNSAIYNQDENSQEEKGEDSKKDGADKKKEEAEDEEEIKKKDKGFTRCKILILTPFKGDANIIIKEIISQFTQKDGLSKTSFKQRYEEYFEDPDKFAEDDFRMGIALTKSKSVKLFSSFEHSDIIVCSPLGLRLKVGAKGEKDREFSFLSSIECLVLDRAFVMYMQNFNHLEEVMEIMNKIPKHQKMNYSLDEIRPYYYDNFSKIYRQNIVYTECNFPELNSLKNRFFSNYKGQITNKPFYPPLFSEKDLLFNQEFNKIEIQDFQNELEERFLHFKNKVWEKWREVDNAVIFCSSYFEYLKLKDYLAKINASFQGVCEYTKKNRIHSRTTLWAKQEFRTILYSERTSFFDLWYLKKQKHILFYSLPRTASIYKELLENIDAPNQKTTIQCLFTQYDAIWLEKIVGTANTKEFLADYNKSTSFIL